MKLKSFQELIVWQRAMDVIHDVYLLTQHLPRDEQYGLSSQMRRAAISIASNIAEGYERRTTKDYIHFLHIAQGSVAELMTQLLVTSRQYGDINVSQSLSRLTEVQKMLRKMNDSLSP